MCLLRYTIISRIFVVHSFNACDDCTNNNCINSNTRGNSIPYNVDSICFFITVGVIDVLLLPYHAFINIDHNFQLYIQWIVQAFLLISCIWPIKLPLITTVNIDDRNNKIMNKRSNTTTNSSSCFDDDNSTSLSSLLHVATMMRMREIIPALNMIKSNNNNECCKLLSSPREKSSLSSFSLQIKSECNKMKSICVVFGITYAFIFGDTQHVKATHQFIGCLLSLMCNWNCNINSSMGYVTKIACDDLITQRSE